MEFEVHRWALRNTDEARAAAYAALLRRGACVAIDGPLALAAAAASVEHKLAACDALVYATSQLAGARLVTTDADLDGLPGVDFHRKPGSGADSRKARRAARRTTEGL